MRKSGLVSRGLHSIELPFHNVRDELNTNVEIDENYTNEDLEKLDELKKPNQCHLHSMNFNS